MPKARNFVVTVKEPGVDRVAIQFEFYAGAEGFNNPIMVHLSAGTSIQEAEGLARTLNKLGEEIVQT